MSDDDLLRAVEHACEVRGTPVVPTRQVTDVDFIPIEQQTVAGRLTDLADEQRINQIKVGPGSVWWMPEDEEIKGEIDFSAINWDVIEPTAIPDDLIQSHPDVPTPTSWEKLEDKAHTIISAVLVLLTGGFGIFIARDIGIPFVTIGSDIVTIGALAILAGGTFGFVGMATFLVARVGAKLDEKGVGTVLEKTINASKSLLRGISPVEVTWKGLNHRDKDE